MISIRKQSINGSQFNHQELNEMLFDVRNFEPKKHKQLKRNLKQYYDPTVHKKTLINHCFRSHFQVSKVYNSVRIQIQPQLQQPKISSFYDNELLPDLIKISDFFQEKKQQFPNKFIPPLSKNLKKILDELFEQYGFIPNLQRFLLFYPFYLQKHHKLCKNIFQHTQLETLHLLFIGICAAAEMGCFYMINRLAKKFIEEGGDIQWITKGLFPQKLSRIIQLCRLLGRCPWLINQQRMQPLIEQEIWSHKQIAIFCQIIVFTQQMSTICLATGVNIEQYIQQLNLDKLMEYFQEQKKIYVPDIQQSVGISQLKETLCQQQQSPKKKDIKISKKSFKKGQKKSQSLQYMIKIGQELESQNKYKLVIDHFRNILPEFYIIEKRTQTIQYSEYNFVANTYPVLFSLTPEIVDLIMDIYHFSQQMTLNNFGNKKADQKVNTRPFRKALSYYSDNLLGLLHHQYQFMNIGQKLVIPLKFYIRLLTLSPLHINKQVLNELNHEQKQQIGCLDKGHIAVLVANTKMIYSLMMGIRGLGV